MAYCAICKDEPSGITIIQDQILICFQCLVNHRPLFVNKIYVGITFNYIFRMAREGGYIAFYNPANVKTVKDIVSRLEELNIISSTANAKRIEKNCKQCSRKNDEGVRTCWCCGIENPV